MKLLTHTLAFLIALTPALTCAQSKDKSTIEFRTLCIQKSQHIPELYHVPISKSSSGKITMKEPLQIELPEVNLSLDVYKTQTRTLLFYPTRPTSPQDLPKPAAKVTIPSGITKALLLFIPAKDGKSYSISVHDASFIKFKGGQQRFVNLTPAPIGVKIASKRLSIKPGKSGHLDFDQKEKKRFPLELFYQKEGKWNRFSASRITIDPRLRRLILCYYDRSENRISSRAIWDRVDQQQPTEQKQVKNNTTTTPL